MNLARFGFLTEFAAGHIIALPPAEWRGFRRALTSTTEDEKMAKSPKRPLVRTPAPYDLDAIRRNIEDVIGIPADKLVRGDWSSSGALTAQLRSPSCLPHRSGNRGTKGR